MKTKVKCPLCGSEKTKVLQKKVKDPVSLMCFSVRSCDSCLVGYTHPVPEKLESYYNQENYDSYQKKTGVYNTIYSVVQNINSYYKLNIIKTYGYGALLDFGAGSGNFVKQANKAGYNSVGFEPINKQINENITNKIEDIKKTKYKLSTLWHVLEHTKKPKELLLAIKGLLSEGGKIIIAVPNIGSYDNIYYKNSWAGYDVPRHVYHFNQSSFVRLLSDVILNVVASRPL